MHYDFYSIDNRKKYKEKRNLLSLSVSLLRTGNDNEPRAYVAISAQSKVKENESQSSVTVRSWIASTRDRDSKRGSQICTC